MRPSPDELKNTWKPGRKGKHDWVASEDSSVTRVTGTWSRHGFFRSIDHWVYFGLANSIWIQEIINGL